MPLGGDGPVDPEGPVAPVWPVFPVLPVWPVLPVLPVWPVLPVLTIRTGAFCRVATPGVPASLVLPRTLVRVLTLPRTLSPNTKL